MKHFAISALMLFCFSNQVLATDLIGAIKGNDFKSLAGKLEKERWSDYELAEALMAAVVADRPIFVKKLLDVGAKQTIQIEGWNIEDMEALGAVNTFTASRYTPVAMAAREGNIEVLEILLQLQGDPNGKTAYNWVPLHHVVGPGWANPLAARLLLSYGADVNAITTLNITPLHRSASYCNLELVKILLENGSRLDLVDNKQNTPQQRAMKSGCQNIAELIAP